jgi:hypothetical protein
MIKGMSIVQHLAGGPGQMDQVLTRRTVHSFIVPMPDGFSPDSAYDGERY